MWLIIFGDYDVYCVGYSSLLMLSRVLFRFVSLFFHFLFFSGLLFRVRLR